MYANYKIVCNTAAGRRRYMQYLIPYIIASPIVDRYDIWINTHNSLDIEFFKRIAKAFPKINLIWQPDGIVDGNNTINAFYKLCTEEDTIYFKLDDDIIWMEPNAIENMVKFRVENPDYWCVTPLVINNAISTFLLSESGKINTYEHFECYANSKEMWKSAKFAVELHNWFLEDGLRKGNYADLHLGKHPIAMARFSINAVLWFGKDMKECGTVENDDEEFMSVIHPNRIGKINCWNGDVIVSHFAFFTQRNLLDKKNILTQYGEYHTKTWADDEIFGPIFSTIKDIMMDIERNRKSICKIASPYRHSQKKKKAIHKRVWKTCRDSIRDYFKNKKESKKTYIKK